MWGIEKATGYDNKFKKYSRKHEAEASAALNNLQVYVDVLNDTNNLQLANKLSFVHSEPEGIVAIDERGVESEKKGKLKATRLYVYAAVINQTVHLLGIGDKDSQNQDLKNYSKVAKRLKKQG